jgi:hypothetical protein
MGAAVELPDHLRAAVMAVAARKGHRGYSRVIVEAVEFYLAEKEAKESGLQDLLDLRGSWSSRQAASARTEISRQRKSWKKSER